MKIQIISDLHQEFGITELSFDNTDVVVIAGDINLGIKGLHWIQSRIKDKPVIYVLGNHEYYKSSYPKILNKLRTLAKNTNIHVLEDSFFDIDDIRFHGCTLWTDFSIFGNPMEYGIICQAVMNDYKMIKRDPSYSKIRTIDTYKIHQVSRKWLDESLQDSKKSKNIVITHHAPSLQSVSEQYKNDPVTAAYASNMEDFILKHQAAFWIHGHIHTPTRYHIGKTEIICNPHGYIDEPYNGYQKELIIDV
ncbi:MULTISPECIES: metallophosphoesterase [unclassified Sphingobacterium]|uniref:metallophosphoesterase n=1 Tax=unclassified Sphingobacterium TaxID=2609468 RepID=UPI0020C285CA|nr:MULTISPECIES: metallophosphoesterase [unclassified Sphingobacterium]